MDHDRRLQRNQEFLQRLLRRRPQDRRKYEERLRASEAHSEAVLEAVDFAEGRPTRGPGQVLETIVDEERPVLFVRDGWLDTDDVSLRGDEARELVQDLVASKERILPMLPLVGRVDTLNFPGEFVGTGWFVTQDIVVTNRHVASLIARWDGRRFVFGRGLGGQTISSSLCTAHEKDGAAARPDQVFAVKEVLYIEPERGPHDIAFVRVVRPSGSAGPAFVPIAATDAATDTRVCVVGYPAKASLRVIPDQGLMRELYRDRYDVKRVAPGFTMSDERGTGRHDCTTLGGNSGSLVLDLRTGQAVGLHFAGLYQEANFSVRATILRDYVQRRRWDEPYEVRENSSSRPPEPPRGGLATPNAPRPSDGTVTFTVPLSVSLRLGTPVVAGAGTQAAERGTPNRETVERASKAFWQARPEGVLAVRVGYFDDGGSIGDTPFIAASVLPSRLAEVARTAPRSFEGVEVRYLAAEVGEQVESLLTTEAVDEVAYDDDARTGEEFSLEPIEETMDLLLHVGPEYSWDVLRRFLDEAEGPLVSAMYEFHAKSIRNAIQARLEQGASLALVLDNATFGRVHDDDQEFDRERVFEDWERRFGSRFKRIVAPEGSTGLIANSYHIKVTVGNDNSFWLSSGNWKMGSSQPVITDEQRDAVPEEDLPGNREWHVVARNKTLAGRFRRHILQDFSRSKELGGGELPGGREEEGVVEVPIEEAVVLERRPPGRVLKPKQISGRPIRVRPLLTPDGRGSLFAKAVLRLIDSAQESLLFQIPYIGMPPNPSADRGYIDELIRALTHKLKTLTDARVLLRSGGKQYSSPTHAAWYFKSKGVDIGSRVRVIENHHTKGMIVDGKRVLVGSHNWSRPGVTLNRDASLLFDDAEVAAYYAEAFEIDWERANPVQPRRFADESVGLEAPGSASAPRCERVRLSELSDDA